MVGGSRAVAPVRWRAAELVERREETPRAVTLEFDVSGWEGHRPGQHVDVRLTAEDGYQAQRSYSIASAPEDERLALTVERLLDGEVSPYLGEELRAGDEIELRGPIGGYFVWEADGRDDRPLLLVGGGSGFVPLMAMLRHRAHQGATPPTRALVSARTHADVLYRDELDALAAGDPTLTTVTTLTRAQPPGWTGYARRVDAALLAEAGFGPEGDPDAFVCGPTSFVEGVAEALVAAGHAAQRVRTERFGPTGT
jgi:ferredoxin-NADP reductase